MTRVDHREAARQVQQRLRDSGVRCRTTEDDYRLAALADYLFDGTVPVSGLVVQASDGTYVVLVNDVDTAPEQVWRIWVRVEGLLATVDEWTEDAGGGNDWRVIATPEVTA